MSLISWYPLNGDTLDYSGNNNNLTNNAAITNANGKIGNCYSFDGSSAYLSGNTPINSSSDFTISFWTKMNSLVTHCLFSCRTAVGDGISIFAISNTIRFDTNSAYQWTTPYSVPTGTWVHITVTKNSQYKKLYINGVLNSSTNSVSNPTLYTMFTIGASQSNMSSFGNYLNGYLNDYRIYDTVLTDKEIYELSKAKILHYNFNDFQEPTTNLMIPSYVPTLSSDVGNTASIQPYTYNGMSGYRITKTVNAGWGTFLQWAIVNNNFSDTTSKYSFSVYAASMDSNPNGQKAHCFFANGPSQNVAFSAGYGTSLTNTLQRYNFEGLSIQSGYTPGNNDTYWHQDFGVCDVFISCPQIEVKDHCTPFTIGSRNGIVRDCSGYGNDAVLDVNTPAWIKGDNLGIGCYNFTPKTNTSSIYGDCNVITCNSVNLPNDSFTFSFWTYRTQDGFQGGSLFRLGAYGDIGIDTRDSGVDLYATNKTSIARLDNINPPLNAWTHNCIVFNRSNLSLKYYRNGIVIASTTLSQNLDISPVNNHLNIGISNAGGVWRFYNGKMDDFRLYATALSDTDISNLYQLRASLDVSGNIFINQLRYAFPKSAYDIKQKYPNAKSGIYTIQPDPNIDPFDVYCDMTTSGGGWTLLVCNPNPNSYPNWTMTTILSLNANNPSITAPYSILNMADKIKSNISGNLQYRIDAVSFGRWGGVWQAPYTNTFTGTTVVNNSTNIEQYDSASWAIDTTINDTTSLTNVMPWIGNTTQLLSTWGNAGSWWGTIVTGTSWSGGYTPYINGPMGTPNVIWYWVR